MSEFPELRAALVAAAVRESERAPAAERSVGGRDAGAPAWRGWRGRLATTWRWRPVGARAAVVALLASASVTAVALAAAGVLSFGSPAKLGLVVQPGLGTGTAVASSVRLLPIRASDPGGGPAWGLRQTKTTRGDVCLTVGRVVDGRIGALGRDGAFGNDGRLHPFARALYDPRFCAEPDPTGHAFMQQAELGFPASAVAFGLVAHAGGCQTGRAGPDNRGRPCPRSAMRNLYYGLLGPDAVSVTYRSPAGGTRTISTGPDGAFLIVLPHRHGPTGQVIGGESPPGTSLVSVRFRGGRPVCHPHGSYDCGRVGEHAGTAPHVTAAQVRAPVHVRAIHARAYCQSPRSGVMIACDHHVPRGFSRMKDVHPGAVLLDFWTIARHSVRTTDSTYMLNEDYSRSPTCFSEGGGIDIEHNVRAGQRLRFQDLLSRSCLGPVHGSVQYYPAGAGVAMTSGPPTPHSGPLIVGRFAIDPDRGARRASPGHRSLTR